jgi:hypothetical protein
VVVEVEETQEEEEEEAGVEVVEEAVAFSEFHQDLHGFSSTNHTALSTDYRHIVQSTNVGWSVVVNFSTSAVCALSGKFLSATVAANSH